MYTHHEGGTKRSHEHRGGEKVRARSAKAGSSGMAGGGVMSPPSNYITHNPIEGKFPATKRMSAISPVLRRTRSSVAGAKAKSGHGHHADTGKAASGSALLSKPRGSSPVLGRMYSGAAGAAGNSTGVCTPVLQMPTLSSLNHSGFSFSPSYSKHGAQGHASRYSYTPPMSPPVTSPRGPGGKVTAGVTGPSLSNTPATHADPHAMKPSVVHVHNSMQSSGSGGSYGATPENTSAGNSMISGVSTVSSLNSSAYAPSPMAKPVKASEPTSHSPKTPVRRSNTGMTSMLVGVSNITTPAPTSTATPKMGGGAHEAIASPSASYHYPTRTVLSPHLKHSHSTSRKSTGRSSAHALAGAPQRVSAFAAYDASGALAATSSKHSTTHAPPAAAAAGAPTTPLCSGTAALLPAKAATQPPNKQPHAVAAGAAPTGLDASLTARKLLFDADAGVSHHKHSASVGAGAPLRNEPADAKAREVPSHISNIECTWSAPGQENQGDYGKGGYLKVARGDRLNNGRYHVVCKLGWGEFSTVWLCWDESTRSNPPANPTKQFVAVKISKCSPYVLSSTKDEVNLLEYIRDKLGDQKQDAPVTTIIDSFEHKGPHGTHICMVFPVLGQNMLCLVEQGHRHHQAVLNNSSRGRRTREDVAFVKDSMRCVLQGMKLLDRLHICHTDLKPENVLLTTVSLKIRKEMRAYQDELGRQSVTWNKAQLVSTAEQYSSQEAGEAPVRISDFGLSFILNPSYLNSAPASKLTSNSNKVVIKEPGWALNPLGITMQTREYRAPEILLGASFSCTTDIWSIGCIAYELVTGNFLMDPKKSSGGKPKAEEDINIDHMCMIQQLLGDHANNQEGKYERKYYHRDGRFRYKQRLEKYFTKRRLEHELRPFLSATEAAELASFIHFCLSDANPRKRPSAEECLRHRWLAGGSEERIQAQLQNSSREAAGRDMMRRM